MCFTFNRTIIIAVFLVLWFFLGGGRWWWERLLFSPPFSCGYSELTVSRLKCWNLATAAHVLPTPMAQFRLWSTNIIVLLLPFLRKYENVQYYLKRGERPWKYLPPLQPSRKKERWPPRVVIYVCDFSIPVKDPFTCSGLGCWVWLERDS